MPGGSERAYKKRVFPATERRDNIDRHHDGQCSVVHAADIDTIRRRGPQQGWSTGHKAPRWAAGRTGLPRRLTNRKKVAGLWVAPR
eukprot:1190885-Prorocentrum_minimum.AAC.3